MIVATVFCVVVGGYVAHEAKIVSDRRAFLIENDYILRDTWRVTEPTRALLILRLLGAESACLVTVNGPAEAHGAVLGPDALMAGRERIRQLDRTVPRPSMITSRHRANCARSAYTRHKQIIGRTTRVASTQGMLLDAAASAPSFPVSGWQAITDAEARLAAFHTDSEQTAARRAEAEGVLRIDEQRVGHLDVAAEFRRSGLPSAGRAQERRLRRLKVRFEQAIMAAGGKAGPRT
jgi:hypothetical protein